MADIYLVRLNQKAGKQMNESKTSWKFTLELRLWRVPDFSRWSACRQIVTREGGTAFGYLALKSLIIPPMKSRFPHRLKYSTAIKVLSSGSYWGPTMIKGNLRVSFT